MKPWLVLPGEYTLGNLAFAETVLAIKMRSKINVLVGTLSKAEGKPSLPTTIGLEKQVNPVFSKRKLERFCTMA